jgi:hypothetical protein
MRIPLLFRSQPRRTATRAAILALALGAGLFLGLLTLPPLLSSAARGHTTGDAPADGWWQRSAHELTPCAHLPVVLRDYSLPSYRVGYCATDGPITRYAEIGVLAGGWYLNFGVQEDPVHLPGQEHVQVIRLHQMTDCWPDRTRDRDTCPYTEPYTYTLTSPSTITGIVEAAQANPGALWLIGNEMDRRDWEGGGQDEMLPGLYAVAYKDLYDVIKGADPTASVGIGGVVQATPARLQYLSVVWSEYQIKYEMTMPVDVWNVHNFIFKEACDDFGADMPPGNSNCYGTMYDDADHNSLVVFDQQIRAFRQWMKNRGQQEKPLLVSEFGIVYFHAGLNDEQLVRQFMLDTFNYLMETKDCSLGYAADDCRLVQRWAWYSLDDSRGIYNDYAYLFDRDTLQMTSLGEAFSTYARAH